MMKIVFNFLFLVLSVLFYGTYSYAVNIDDYIEGGNYTGGNYTGKKLYVSFLKEGFRLEKRNYSNPNETNFLTGFPYEAWVRVYIIKEDKVQKEIKTLNDFESYALIDTKEKALEFVRFRTSEQTFYLFRPDVMIEVDADDNTKQKKQIYGICSKKNCSKYQIKTLEIINKENYFEIQRYLLGFPWPGQDNFDDYPTLYHVVENVYKNGRYEIIKTKIADGFNHNEISYPCIPY